MKSSLHILYVVASKKAFPEHHILAGQVGTIVEILENGYMEVEFHLSKEEDPILIPVHKNHLMKLHFQLEQA